MKTGHLKTEDRPPQNEDTPPKTEDRPLKLKKGLLKLKTAHSKCRHKTTYQSGHHPDLKQFPYTQRQHAKALELVTNDNKVHMLLYIP
jgi:hypothetical protein